MMKDAGRSACSLFHGITIFTVLTQRTLVSYLLRSSLRFVPERSTDIKSPSKRQGLRLGCFDTYVVHLAFHDQEQSKSQRKYVVSGVGNVEEANMTPSNNSSPRDKSYEQSYSHLYMCSCLILPTDERHSKRDQPPALGTRQGTCSAEIARRGPVETRLNASPDGL